MRIVLSVGLLLFTQLASATMYFAAYEPSTGEIGLVYSSSGAHFWQTLVKGKGLAGAQNYGLCDSATPEEFLNQGLSATEIAHKIKEQCDAEDYYSYRFLVVTADGHIDYVIGRDGCSIPDCGARRGENFVITGGGLEAGVLDAAVNAYQSQPRDISFTCRLFRTLRELYKAGGEVKEFAGSSITVDGPGKAEIMHVQTDTFNGGGQLDMLTRLHDELKAKGEDCGQ